MLLQQMMARWEVRSEVDRVFADLAWLERLFALLSFAERLVLALALVLAAGVMLVMGNTMALENRRGNRQLSNWMVLSRSCTGVLKGFGGQLFCCLQASLSSCSLKPGPDYRDDFALTGLDLLAICFFNS